MERKKINIVVEGTCELCPFCTYNSDYSRSYDSGYDCHNPDTVHFHARIANDMTIGYYDKTIKEYEDSLKTFFPQEKPTRDHPLTIPTWCPLENV